MSMLAVTACGQSEEVTLCNFWPGKNPVISGQVLGMWEYRDPTNGCRYISGKVHGNYTHDGGRCWGPQSCRTIPRSEWEAEQAAKQAAEGGE